MKLMRLHKFQNAAIHLWALGLHHIENECGRSVAALMHDTKRFFYDALNADLAFQNALGVIQHRIDGVHGIAIARQLEE